MPIYYVSPDGNGSGRKDNPMSLDVALAEDSPAAPGDTVYVGPGRYVGAFVSAIEGAPGLPITICTDPTNPAVIDVANAAPSQRRGDAFVVRGGWTTWRGLVFTCSDPVRRVTRPNMVVNDASHTRYQQLVIKDGGIGFFTYPSRYDVEVAECVVYNNGWQGSASGGGHGLYLKSDFGPVIARDNIIFNNFGYGIQVYSDLGSGRLVNVALEGNVVFNSGAPSEQYDSGGNANILIGGQEPAAFAYVADNIAYFSAGHGVYNVVLGLGQSANWDIVFRRNTVVGGRYGLSVGHWERGVVVGNLLGGDGVLVRLKPENLDAFVWAQNIYTSSLHERRWLVGNLELPYGDWVQKVGLNAVGSDMVADDKQVRVWVKPSTVTLSRR